MEKKRMKSGDCLTRDPGKTFLAYRCQKPSLGSGDYERSCSKQPFSGCLKAKVNLPVYLPFVIPATILKRATLNST